MKKMIIPAALLPLALAACSGHKEPKKPVGPTRTAVALIVTAKGHEVGTATATSNGNGLRFDLEAADMKPGVHSVEIDKVGKCDGPDFKSAGAQWVPQDKLPTLNINANGNGSLTFRLGKSATFDGLMDTDGSAVIVNQDEKAKGSSKNTPPLACGVFKVKKAAPPVSQTPSINLPSPSPMPSSSPKAG